MRFLLASVCLLAGCLPSAPRVDDRAEPTEPPESPSEVEGETYRARGVGCQVVSAYEPSERAQADQCYPLEIDPQDCVAEALGLADAMARDGLASRERLLRCLDGAEVFIPADDEAFQERCGGDGGTLGCTFASGDTYPIILRWDLTLVVETFSRPVIRHEMIHRAFDCLYGDGDADHERKELWLEYESWEQYDADPDGNGESGCQTTCGGC